MVKQKLPMNLSNKYLREAKKIKIELDNFVLETYFNKKD